MNMSSMLIEREGEFDVGRARPRGRCDRRHPWGWGITMTAERSCSWRRTGTGEVRRREIVRVVRSTAAGMVEGLVDGLPVADVWARVGRIGGLCGSMMSTGRIANVTVHTETK